MTLGPGSDYDRGPGGSLGRPGAARWLRSRSFFGKPSWSVFMRPTKRYGVNKHSSARSFRHDTSRTNAKNMRGVPMRGGYRL